MLLASLLVLSSSAIFSAETPANTEKKAPIAKKSDAKTSDAEIKAAAAETTFSKVKTATTNAVSVAKEAPAKAWNSFNATLAKTNPALVIAITVAATLAVREAVAYYLDEEGTVEA